jgi:peptidoglycan/xylan/chitin deacetylase (PgdA/CDA1 family)
MQLDTMPRLHSRRRFLQWSAASLATALPVTCATRQAFGADDVPAKARVAITLDLEMSAQYPRREVTEWNYEKGNLDQATKDYAVEAARLVKERGGRIHFFCVGRVLEQPDVQWLQEIAKQGHPIGNHTYDHVNVLATRPEETQFRFQRAPWLVQGETSEQIIRRNVRLTSLAMKQRLGIEPNGFRTPGGFATGLHGRPDVQQLLREEGFRWISSKYPSHDSGPPETVPGEKVFASVVAAQAEAQPFTYPDGLVDLPMNPISDVHAFRTNRWPLASFLQAIEHALAWVIEGRQVYDFLAHPSCLVVEDAKMESLRRICDLVEQADGAAEIVTLDQIAAPLLPS